MIAEIKCLGPNQEAKDSAEKLLDLAYAVSYILTLLPYSPCFIYQSGVQSLRCGRLDTEI